MNSYHRRFHRVFGLLLALPLFLWMVTGILFNVKYRYAEAYETLKIPTLGNGWHDAHLSPAELIERNCIDPDARFSLLNHPSNRPAYAGSKLRKPVVIDAGTGAEIPAAGMTEAQSWVQSAIAASSNGSRYGVPLQVHETTHTSSLTGGADPAFAVELSGGKTVIVDRLTGEMSQTGRLNDWIDFTYRVHYLQWTPWKPLNVALVLIAAPLAFALAFSGVRMFFRG